MGLTLEWRVLVFIRVVRTFRHRDRRARWRIWNRNRGKGPMVRTWSWVLQKQLKPNTWKWEISTRVYFTKNLWKPFPFILLMNLSLNLSHVTIFFLFSHWHRIFFICHISTFGACRADMSRAGHAAMCRRLRQPVMATLSTALASTHRWGLLWGFSQVAFI